MTVELVDAELPPLISNQEQLQAVGTEAYHVAPVGSDTDTEASPPPCATDGFPLGVSDTPPACVIVTQVPVAIQTFPAWDQIVVFALAVNA